MFDETNWNRPFGFENVLTISTTEESEEMLNLLNEPFFDEGFCETMGSSWPVTDYQAKTQMKMSMILESARQASRSVTPKSNQEVKVIKVEAEEIIKVEIVGTAQLSTLIKRCHDVDVTPAAKVPRVRKPKVTSTTPVVVQAPSAVVPLPPVNKLIQFSTRYVDIYVNVMNSGSFTTIQKFLFTYMARPCKLLVGHDVRATFRVPKLSTAEGPALMAHYFLGCLVMFPDMLVDLKGSSTVTSPEGRKIVLRVETRATKSVDIPAEDWLPMISTLQDTYERFLQQPVSSSQARENVVEAHLQAQHEGVYTQSLCAGLQGRQQNQEVSGVARVGSGSDGSCSDSETSVEATVHTTNIVTPRPLYENLPLIPESYVKSLYAKAKLLPSPKPLVMRGTITLQLDDNDHIYDITTDLVQVNV